MFWIMKLESVTMQDEKELEARTNFTKKLNLSEVGISGHTASGRATIYYNRVFEKAKQCYEKELDMPSILCCRTAVELALRNYLTFIVSTRVRKADIKLAIAMDSIEKLQMRNLINMATKYGLVEDKKIRKKLNKIVELGNNYTHSNLFYFEKKMGDNYKEWKWTKEDEKFMKQTMLIEDMFTGKHIQKLAKKCLQDTHDTLQHLHKRNYEIVKE